MPTRLFLRILLLAVPLVLVVLVTARAHFGVVVPSRDIVESADQRDVSLEVLFTHPFEDQPMDMARPRAFGVSVRGGDIVDLLGTLREEKAGGCRTWKTTYTVRRPGDHVFFVEPEPYWEPSEGKYIVHYTKVVVNAFGREEGWDEPLGLRTEIVPLVRPYGLYTGNLFRGIVRLDGRPVPYAEIEVEHLNPGGKLRAPAGAFVTQVVKADGNGVFAYAMPRAGWWGFAALNEDTRNLVREGKAVPVELGAVMWVRCEDMP